MAQLPELDMQKRKLMDEIQTVENLLNNNQKKHEVGFILSLARNHYALNNYSKAETYYLQVITNPICSPLDFKALAISLLNNGKYSLAEEFRAIYLTKSNDVLFNDLWESAKKLRSSSQEFNRSAITNYNTVYGSSGKDGNHYLSIDRMPAKVNIQCGQVSNMEALMLPVDDIARLGSVTPGPESGSFIYSYEEDDGYYSLYLAKRKKDSWKKPMKLKLGESLAHYIHPLFDIETNTLFYSSNKSGGQGGFDLYSISWYAKEWVSNVNLGKAINTDNNEILPSHYDGQIVYSSNGHPGFGGYDILVITQDRSSVRLLGATVNSIFDDLMVLDNNNGSALTVSVSDGQSNIFEYGLKLFANQYINGEVELSDGSSSENALVLLEFNSKEKGLYTSVKSNGKFSFTISDSIEKWKLTAIKSGYRARDVMTPDESNRDFVITLDPLPKTEPEKVFIVNSPSKNVIPTTPNKEDSASNRDQKNVFNEMDSSLGRYYVIFGSTRSYKSAYEFWNQWKGQFPNAEILKYQAKGIYRIGEYAGTSSNEAMIKYKRAKDIKPDVWLLRPDTQ